MSPQEIIDAYNVLSQDVQNNAAQEAARVGNAQRSIGVMAERVANPSGQTSGLANYTYNRTMRPAVETNAAALVTQGKAQAMQKYLSDELMKAKNAYEDAKNKYQVSSSAASADSMKQQQRQVNYVSDSQYTGQEEKQPEKQETVENTDQVVTGTSMLPWGNGAGGYIMLGTPWRGEGSPGQYCFQDRNGNVFYMDLPEGHEFVVDPSNGNLVTRPKQ